MHIKIAERMRPFSHTAGTYCMVPRTQLRLQIFPALIIVHDLSQSEPQLVAEIVVPVKGPVKEFTIQLDLERGFIQVWGEGLDGYFRYGVYQGECSFSLAFDIEKGLSSWEPKADSKHDSFSIHPVVLQKNHFPVFFDRLSLGSHKKQDWDQVKRRGDLTEILPIWLRLGQFFEQSNVSYEGTAEWLKICQNAKKMEAYQAFQNLFNLGFEGILSPRLADHQHQGFELSPAPASLSPLILLTEGAKAIRALFIHCHQHEIFVLPNLPPQFHCGRFLQVKCYELGLLDFEWTKKSIRCMVFRSETKGSIAFHFPKEIVRYRLNGQVHQAGSSLEVEKGQVYIFDQFQR